MINGHQVVVIRTAYSQGYRLDMVEGASEADIGKLGDNALDLPIPSMPHTY
jgi:hypothetical protein